MIVKSILIVWVVSLVRGYFGVVDVVELLMVVYLFLNLEKMVNIILEGEEGVIRDNVEF